MKDLIIVHLLPTMIHIMSFIFPLVIILHVHSMCLILICYKYGRYSSFMLYCQKESL